MARRRKEDEVLTMVAQLVGLAILFVIIFPQGRQLLSALALPAIVFFILACFGLAAFIIYRLAKAKPLEAIPSSPFAARQTVSLPPPPRIAVDLHGGASKSASAPSPKLPGKLELTQRLRTIDWFQFEKIVALAYRKHGYTVSRRGGANPDGGIDLLIRKDGETKAVQCKQWKTWNVGVKTVREFLGALTDAQIKQGILITLCGYTDEARQLAAKHGIEMLNETALANLLERVDARFDPSVMAILEDKRKVCPKCEREMVLRSVSRGANAGQKFWGCSGYPRCHFTMPLST
jgi:restriction system protein